MCETGCICVCTSIHVRLLKNQQTNKTIFTGYHPWSSIHRDITSSPAEGWKSGFELCTEQLSLRKQLNVTLIQSYTQPFTSKANLCRHMHFRTKCQLSRDQESCFNICKVTTNKCDNLWNKKAMKHCGKSQTHIIGLDYCTILCLLQHDWR